MQGGDASNFNAGYNSGTISQVNHHNITNNVDIRLGASDSALKELYANIAPGALHNSAERSDAPKCHPETREAVQQDIFSWINRGEGQGQPEQILWLTGPAGAGKTAIMGTISDMLEENGQLAASFYFAAYTNSLERKSKRRFVTTLAYQLQRHPALKGHISKAMLSTVHDDPAVFSTSLKGQFESLILEPLRLNPARRYSPSGPPLVIVIDGLDECGEDQYDIPHRSREKDQIEVLSLLIHAIRDPNFPFRFIIASRPESWIRSFFEAAEGHVAEIFLNNKYDPDADISLYLKSKFTELSRRYGFAPSTWPRDEDIKTLVRNASGQFIYASTILRFIDAPPAPPKEQLDIVLSIKLPEGGKSPFAPLDALYVAILNSSPSPAETVLWLKAHAVLQSETRSQRYGDDKYPSAWTIDRLFETSEGQARVLFGLPSLIFLKPQNRCDSAVHGKFYNVPASITPKDKWASMYSFYHQSFLDFLQDAARSGAAFPEITDRKVERWIWERLSHVLLCGGPEVPIDEALLPTFKTCFIFVLSREIERSEKHMKLNQDMLSKCDPNRWFSPNVTLFWSFRSGELTLLDRMFSLVHKQCRFYRPCSVGCRRWRKAILEVPLQPDHFDVNSRLWDMRAGVTYSQPISVMWSPVISSQMLCVTEVLQRPPFYFLPPPWTTMLQNASNFTTGDVSQVNAKTYNDGSTSLGITVHDGGQYTNNVEINAGAYHHHEARTSDALRGAIPALNRLQPDVTKADTKSTELYANVVVGAMHNSEDRADAPKCHAETRKAVQEDILSWIGRGREDGTGPRQLLWLTGPAGAGKTAIMGTVCDRLKEKGQLAATFYFSSYSGLAERKSKRSFVTTLAYQLQGLPLVERHISSGMMNTIQRNPSILRMDLKTQMETLILQNLRESQRNRLVLPIPPLTVVVDGVDECGEDHDASLSRSKENDQVEILSVLLQALQDSAFPFRLIVASRPEPWIRRFFAESAPGRVKEIFLNNKYGPDKDITLFLRSKFSEIRRRHELPLTWPEEETIQKLVSDASGQFIYAATVVRFVDTKSKLPQNQLDIILKIRPPDGSLPFDHLDLLYTSILRSSPSPGETVLWLKGHQLLQQTVSAISNGQFNLSAWTTDRLFESSAGQARLLLELPSLVHLQHDGLRSDTFKWEDDIPESARPKRGWNSSYAFYHKSFQDFLMNPMRCGAAFPGVGEREVELWVLGRLSRVLLNDGPEVPMDPALLPTFRKCFGSVWAEWLLLRSERHLSLTQDFLAQCDPTSWLFLDFTLDNEWDGSQIMLVAASIALAAKAARDGEERLRSYQEIGGKRVAGGRIRSYLTDFALSVSVFLEVGDEQYGPLLQDEHRRDGDGRVQNLCLTLGFEAIAFYRPGSGLSGTGATGRSRASQVLSEIWRR
ncbi:hypothetical protein NMY22_g10827 [Coprinellus aureogranulatus]|nr:hypothetical protein NMY22_g10827 [Coprinellus aureogranulatus]